ncbi:MAG: tetratricopeptide repeat protein [Pirellulales bacterium]|nr:tetratricopeptide repeat protein [Pirellulales bacterium]
MKTFNVRLAAVLLVGTLVFGVGVYFLHGFQMRRNAGFFLDKAEIAKKEAKTARDKSDAKGERKAIQEQLENLGWFFRLAPEDTRSLDAREEYGMLMADNIRDATTFSAAYSNLDWVVRDDPDRAAPRKKLIELWLRVSRFIDARPHIEFLLAKKPDDPEMLTFQGRCLAGLGENKKAKASFLDAIKFSPRQLEAYYHLAELLQRNPELCDSAGSAGGGNPAGAALSALDPKTVLERMIEQNPDSAKAHYYMSFFLLNRREKADEKQKEEAFRHIEESLKLAPGERDALFLAAKCSLERKKFEKAREYALKGLELEKENEIFRKEMYVSLAFAEFGLKDGDPSMEGKQREKAMAILQKGFAESKDPAFLSIRAEWQIDAGEIEAAQATIKELAAKRNFDGRALEFLRGRIFLHQSKWPEACRALENARPFFANRQDLQAKLQAKLLEYWLGLCYGNMGNPDQAILAFQRALNIDPSYEPAVLALNDIKMRERGEITLPLPQILPLIKSTKDPRLLASLIQQAIATKSQLPEEERNWRELEEILYPLLKSSTDPAVLTAVITQTIALKGQLPKAERHWEQLQEILDEIQKKIPDFPELPLHRCEVLMAEERFEEAEKLLRGLLEKNPRSPPNWRALAIVLALQKKYDAAEEALAGFEKNLGDTPELRLAKVDFYLRRDGKDAVPRLKALAENIDGFDDRQKNAIFTGLLNAMRLLGAQEEIRRLTQLMAERNPNNLQYLMLSFEQAGEAGDAKRMEKLSADIERVEGHRANWLYSQAALRIRQARDGGAPALLGEALDLLHKAAEERPSWSKVPFLVGQVFDLKKDVSQALKSYQNAIDLGERNPYAVSRVMQILCDQLRLREANAFVRRLEGEGAPLTVELVKVWVALLLDKEIHDYEAALDKARKVAAAKAGDYLDQIWYGQVMGKILSATRFDARKAAFAGLLAEQEKAFRRAVELNPKASEAWVVLIDFLVSAEKLSDAEKALDEARKHFAGKEGQLALAQCLEVMKKYEQAKEQYGLVLAADPQDARTAQIVAEFFLRSGSDRADRAGDIKQAETLLKRIVEAKEMKPTKADVQRARRSLAWILQARPGYENIERALKLVSKNLEEAPDSAPDLSLLAFLKTRDPRPSVREEAIRAYKLLQENQKASDDDLYKLAQLYLFNKNWPAASELLRELAVKNEEDPQYLSIYLRELLDHGEIGDAEIYLRQLQDKWPNHVRTILLEAELLIRSNKAEEALDLMKSFVERSNSIPPDRGQRMRLMAAALEDFVNRALDVEQKVDAERYLQTAELFLRQYADEHPSSALEVVGFLARQKRFDDAADMLEKTWKSADPVALHQTCMLTTEAGRGAKEVVERVVKILQEAKKQFGDHPTILLALADINVGEGRYQEAEEIYREILQKASGHSVAMNNLAVLLTVAKKNLPEALELIDKAVSITGPLAQMLDTRACVYIAQKKPDKALADLKDVLLDGKTAEALFHQAQAFELLGQDNAAAVAMQEALQMGLAENKLLTPEISAFQRLKELARKLAPVGTSGKAPPK